MSSTSPIGSATTASQLGQVAAAASGNSSSSSAGPLGGLFGLSAPALVLVGEAQAGDHIDHPPPPVQQMEQSSRAAHRLVVGVG